VIACPVTVSYRTPGTDYDELSSLHRLAWRGAWLYVLGEKWFGGSHGNRFAAFSTWRSAIIVEHYTGIRSSAIP
jgi:hypothetical protein